MTRAKELLDAHDGHDLCPRCRWIAERLPAYEAAVEALRGFHKAWAAANGPGDAGVGWDGLARADDAAREALRRLQEQTQ